MICTMADVNVLNLCTLALQTLDCRVLSSNNNHKKFILFQRQRRPEYIKCKVTLLYHNDHIEIKASSCFHRFFFSQKPLLVQLLPVQTMKITPLQGALER